MFWVDRGGQVRKDGDGFAKDCGVSAFRKILQQLLAHIASLGHRSLRPWTCSGKTGELLSGEFLAKQRMERKAELEPEARKLFGGIDEDGSGLLDQEEMAKLATKMGIQLNPEQLLVVMKDIDADGSGQARAPHCPGLVLLGPMSPAKYGWRNSCQSSVR